MLEFNTVYCIWYQVKIQITVKFILQFFLNFTDTDRGINNEDKWPAPYSKVMRHNGLIDQYVLKGILVYEDDWPVPYSKVIRHIIIERYSDEQRQLTIL